MVDGEKEWLKRERIVNVLKNDPTFDKSQRDFMSRTDRYKRATRMTNRIYELQEQCNWSQEETSLAFASIDEQLPIGLHNVAFQPVFFSQGSPELIAKYGALIASRGILGCYLQTELGHGTNVAQLETTATYIPNTDEFEIHSPTLTSTKWWIGALGKTATHVPLTTASEQSWSDPNTAIRLLELRAAFLVREYARTKDQPDASVYQRVSKAVTEAFVAVQVGSLINGLDEDGSGLKGNNSLPVIKGVYHLVSGQTASLECVIEAYASSQYLLTVAEAALVDLLSFRILPHGPGGNVGGETSTDPARSLRLAIDALCRMLLPNAIGLSDAFGFTDWELDSALGVYDGKVYNALWARAQAEPLNMTDVTDAYQESIKSMLDRGRRQAQKAKARL
ncbi:hypothetical protein H0H93_016586 [Arthromyces matolae]|nr:hypothetical protein H0H93_016586 [Arthromyces matolae]